MTDKLIGQIGVFIGNERFIHPEPISASSFILFIGRELFSCFYRAFYIANPFQISTRGKYAQAHPGVYIVQLLRTQIRLSQALEGTIERRPLIDRFEAIPTPSSMLHRLHSFQALPVLFVGSRSTPPIIDIRVHRLLHAVQVWL